MLEGSSAQGLKTCWCEKPEMEYAALLHCQLQKGSTCTGHPLKEPYLILWQQLMGWENNISFQTNPAMTIDGKTSIQQFNALDKVRNEVFLNLKRHPSHDHQYFI